jgi:tripartite-type tricarboxylate transporter receptor subunit TctC
METEMNRRVLNRMVVALGSVLLAATVAAQEKPTLTLLVPTTSATAADLIARLIAPHLSERLKRTVVVENKAGASGIIGMNQVARAKPDGNQVLVSPNSLLTLGGTNKNMPFNPKTDLMPVVPLAVSTMAVFSSPAFQGKGLLELVQVAKRDPGKLNYGSPGIGTPHHLLMEVFKENQGLDITHVPFKGTAGMVTDLAGSRVDVAFMPLHSSVELLKGNKLRLLAIVGDKRSLLFPDVPTVNEQGFKTERFTWTAGIFLPVGTPRAVAQELEQNINAILRLPEVERSLAAAGLTPVIESQVDFGRRYVAEIDQWRKVVEMAGIKPE